jgi:hypothetical protein
VIEHAMSFAGSAPPVDFVGTNENTDIAVERTPGGFRVAVINHGASEMEVMLRPIKPSAGRVFEWIDLVTRNKTETSTTGRSLKLKVPGMGFRALEFRGTSVD